MSSSDNTGTSDLVQVVASGHAVQALVQELVPYFNVILIPVIRGWSKVVCLIDESKLLDEVKDGFTKEFSRSKMVSSNYCI
jgi:hypothetical protein